jgi:hypothetical protein
VEGSRPPHCTNSTGVRDGGAPLPPAVLLLVPGGAEGAEVDGPAGRHVLVVLSSAGTPCSLFCETCASEGKIL